MEFIEENCSHAVEFWIIPQPSLQHAVGDIDNLAILRVARIEPYSISHFVSHFGSQQARYESGKQPRSNPTGLDYDDHATDLTGFQQHNGDPCGLS